MGNNIRFLVAALLATACTETDGRGVADWMEEPDGPGGKGDSTRPEASSTCLQALADGASLPAGCDPSQLAAEFVDSPLGPVASLREVRTVSVEGLAGDYVDLAMCQTDEDLWTGPAAPLANLVPAYADAGNGCHWVPAEDFVGLAFLYVHNHGAYVYNATGGAPSRAARQAAWRLFVQYPDTITHLFSYDVNFGFSYVNRALELYVEDHPELGYDWFADAVDAYVIDRWGEGFADLIRTNNAAHTLPTTVAGEGLVREFMPPLPNAMARAGFDATAEVWERPDAWAVRLAAGVRLSELGEPFAVPANLVAPDLRGLNRIRGATATVVDGPTLPPPSLADASNPLLTVPADPSLPSANTVMPGWLEPQQVALYWASQDAATTSDFDSFYDFLLNHPEGKLVSPDVTWHPDTVLDVSKGPWFHLEYSFNEAGSASVDTILVDLAVPIVNGRAAGPMAQTAPGASRAVLLEEMFHTGQQFAGSFHDIQNLDNEIAFRQFALDPNNLRALGFHNNAEQIALWRHDLATYRMLRQMATNP